MHGRDREPERGAADRHRRMDRFSTRSTTAASPFAQDDRDRRKTRGARPSNTANSTASRNRDGSPRLQPTPGLGRAIDDRRAARDSKTRASPGRVVKAPVSRKQAGGWCEQRVKQSALGYGDVDSAVAHACDGAPHDSFCSCMAEIESTSAARPIDIGEIERFSTSPNNYGEPVRAARSCSTCGSRRAADRYRRNRTLLDERGNFSESARVGRS
jgi:hypothetical protein